MSIAETVLVFVGIPVAIFLVIAALVYGSAGRRASKRYRPGRPFTFAPVWFVAARGGVEETAVSAYALGPGSPVPVIEPAAAGSAPGGTEREEPESARLGPTGGASDRW